MGHVAVDMVYSPAHGLPFEENHDLVIGDYHNLIGDTVACCLNVRKGRLLNSKLSRTESSSLQWSPVASTRASIETENNMTNLVSKYPRNEGQKIDH